MLNTCKDIRKGANMARLRKKGDAAYNARRRYYRQAERYEKQATQAGTAVEAGRLRKLGSRALEKAMQTYEDPTKVEFSKPIQDLQRSLNPKVPLRKPGAGFKSKIIEESEKTATVGGMSESEMQEYEASEILTGSIGRRVFGAFADVWKDSEDREGAILDYFGASNMMEVIEAIEDAGIDIYSDPESEQRYDEIRTAIELAFKR